MSTWQLDTAHTIVSFTAKHMMITKVRGIFKGVTGTIEFDEANPAASSVSVTIPAGRRRDRHGAARQPPPLRRLPRRGELPDR